MSDSASDSAPDPLAARLQPSLDGRYRIERELGAGGMATVYLAEDLRHHRKVAIKVLHAELSAILGSERFLKEIELTANLQHPHILPLFDSGSADGLLFYVMPFVEGETLRGRLDRERQFPVADAVRIASEVGDALEYAHKRGVIHRDIKPENVLLQGGHALVADFGIALAVEQAGGQRMTQTGLSLGTPQYMSPEQATGERNIDARTDIYALGAVTYEMLTGEPPFTGPSAQAIVAKVVTQDPAPIIPQRRSVPPAVEDAVLTALEKLPADRFDSAAEFARAMSATGATGAGRRRPNTEPTTRSHALWIAAAALGAVALGCVGFLIARQHYKPNTPIAAFGDARKVTWEPGLEIQPALSPDGKYVAYAGGSTVLTHIYVRQVAGGRAVKLTDDSTSVETNPQWSADGSRILFLAGGAVFSAPSSGGSPRPEMRAAPDGRITNAVWSPDDRRIAYAHGDSLYLRDADGHSRLLARLREVSACQWRPDGATIACASGNREYSQLGRFLGNLSPSRIVTVDVSDGAVSTVTDSSSVNQSPFWSPDGKWLYFVSDRLGPLDIYALPTARDGRANGSAIRLTNGLGAHSVSISSDGKSVAYDVYSATANLQSLPFPPNGVDPRSALPITTGQQVIEEFDGSPDGKWVYYDSNVSGTSELYRQRLPSGAPEQLTFDSTDDFSPAVSPDGRELAFQSWRYGSRDIYVLPLDGGAVQRVTSSPLQESKPAWSPDGNALAFSIFGPQGSVWVVRRHNGIWGKPVQRTHQGGYSAWSPDGHSIAYTTSTFTGGALDIVDADSGAPRVVFDPAKYHGMLGEQPFWSSDGRELYFKAHDAEGRAQFWSIPVAGGAATLMLTLNNPAQSSFRPEWALRAGRMYFTVDDRQSDVWVMHLTPR